MDGLKLYIKTPQNESPFWVMELWLAGQRVAITEAVGTDALRALLKNRLDYLWALAHGKKMETCREQGNMFHPQEVKL